MENFILFRLIVVTLILTTNLAVSHKILFLLPIATKSHKNVFDPLILALAERGHDLTVVSPLPFKKPLQNVREIAPVSFEELQPSFTSGNPFERRKEGKAGFFLSWNSTFIELACDKLYQNEEIKNIMKHGSFDVVIMNAFMNQCALGIVHKLQAPHGYLVTMPATNMLVGKTGLYFPPSFVPCSFAAFSDRMNFKERVLNFVAEYFLIIVGRLSWNKYLSGMYQKHLGDETPLVSEIDSNVSFILMNSHFSLTYPRPLFPNVVEVGGMHIKEGKPLTNEFETFLSDDKNGFILFSLGSIVQAKDMPDEMRDKFLNVFSRLKQKVVWKWEGEIPDGAPPNVKMVKWVPQQDILSHPNIRMFITHGGLLSTQESVYYGVPLIGFPVILDQDLNMIQAEKAGFALKLEINDFTEDSLEHAINKILTDQTYSNRVKQLSSIFRDQPLRPIDSAVYWVEYIIRHKGAPVLRSASRDLNFLAYFSIDVIIFLMSIVLITLWLVKRLVSLLYQKIFMKNQTKIKSKKTKKNQ